MSFVQSVTPIIGIEIHLELLTKTKMFSPAPNSSRALPNQNIHPIDLAYLGTLPRPNKQVVILAIKLAKALNMQIANKLVFDRKHYYYPDLPKSFQITQDSTPIATKGYVVIQDEEKKEKRVTIQRLQIEEDTSKQIHKETETLMDYNRCGVPLLEIVSDPVFNSATEVTNYVALIRRIANSLKISDAKMEEGSLRVDVNVSLSINGHKGRKVEVKNINSFSNISKAITYEIALQKVTLLSGKRVKQETKRFDEKTQKTVFMRKKEQALEYYYFQEPNIPVIDLDSEFVDSIKIEELPWEKESKLLALGLKQIQINSLLSDNQMYKFFNEIQYPDRKRLANIFFGEIVSMVHANRITFKKLRITPKQIGEAISMVDDNHISSNQLKELFKIIEDRGLQESVTQICERFNIKQVNDETYVEELVEEFFQKHKEFLQKNKANHKRIFSFLLGEILKVTNNTISPQAVAKRVNKKINEL